MLQIFGEDFPSSAAFGNQHKMPLLRETDWSWHFFDKETNAHGYVSKFMDGTASITFEQFQLKWPAWSDLEKHHFTSACHELGGQDDFPDILRFILSHGKVSDWKAIALPASYCLPTNEAFDQLLGILGKVEITDASNIIQAIRHVKHPQARVVLERFLPRIWGNSSIWDDDSFVNPVAMTAMHCIEYLVELGANPNEYEDKVRALAEHQCRRNREFCKSRLGKYYPWLLEGKG